MAAFLTSPPSLMGCLPSTKDVSADTQPWPSTVSSNVCLTPTDTIRGDLLKGVLVWVQIYKTKDGYGSIACLYVCGGSARVLVESFQSAHLQKTSLML